MWLWYVRCFVATGFVDGFRTVASVDAFDASDSGSFDASDSVRLMLRVPVRLMLLPVLLLLLGIRRRIRRGLGIHILLLRVPVLFLCLHHSLQSHIISMHAGQPSLALLR